MQLRIGTSGGAVMNTVIKLHVIKNAENVFNNCITVSFLRRAQLHEGGLVSYSCPYHLHFIYLTTKSQNLTD
jgi:hypothetical protein